MTRHDTTRNDTTRYDKIETARDSRRWRGLARYGFDRAGRVYLGSASVHVVLAS